MVTVSPTATPSRASASSLIQISPAAGGQAPSCPRSNLTMRIGSSAAATNTCSAASRGWPLTSTWLSNWVRPVASITPGRRRTWAATAAIRPALIGRSSTIVADAGWVRM
jgi:hypothetical protein